MPTRYYIYFLCAGLMVLRAALTYGQEPTYRFIGLTDGLPSETVFQVKQDSKGYIWFATEHGAVRYDGHEMRTFNTLDGLCDNTVFALHEDHQGRIWFISKGRCLSYYDHGNIVAHPSFYEQENGMKVGTPINLSVGPNDTIRVGSKDSYHAMIKIDPEGKYYYLPADNYANLEFIDNYSIPTSNKLLEWQKQVNSERKKQQKDSVNLAAALYTQQDSLHLISFGKEGFLPWQIDTHTNELVQHNCKHFNHQLFIQDSPNGQLNWSPLRMFHLPNSKLTVYINDTPIEHQLSSTHPIKCNPEVVKLGPSKYLITFSNDILLVDQGKVTHSAALPGLVSQSLTVDSKGGVWVGLFEKGAIRFENEQLDLQTSKHYFPDIGISSVCEDREGGYWFSTFDRGVIYSPSIKIYDLQDQSKNVHKITPYGAAVVTERHVDQNTTAYRLFATENLPSGKKSGPRLTFMRGKTLFSAKDSSLILSNSQGLLDINPLTGEKQSLFHPRQNFPATQFFEWNDQTYYLYSRQVWVKKADQEIYILTNLDEGNTNTGLYINTYRIFRDTLWIAARKGLLAFDLTLEDWAPNLATNLVLPQTAQQPQLIGQRLFVLLESGDVLLREGSSFRSIRHLLPDSNAVINHLYASGDQSLWLSGSKGLVKMEVKDGSVHEWPVRQFDESHGLPSNMVLQSYVHEQTVWALTNVGLVYFDYNEVNMNAASPPIYITDQKINDRDTVITTGSSLAYDLNSIRFTLSAPTFKHRKGIPFRYKLEGHETRWNFSHEPFANYNRLQPGDYTFVAQAANNDGLWSESPIRFSFTIRPPFWITWWFLSLCGLSIAGVTAVLFRLRIARIKRENALMQAAAEAEHKALRSQMTPHFIFNSLNSIQRLVANNDRIFAIRNMTKFAKLMRMILNNSQESVITLEQEIETLQVYLELESLRFSERFTFEIKLEGDLDTSFIEIPPMLIQPYVENAIWHGIMNKPDKSGHVSVSFREDPDMLRCTVTDNGVGRAAVEAIQSNYQKGHRSLGSQITEKRLKMMGKSGQQIEGQVTIIDLEEHGEATGTQVKIEIPVLWD